MIKNTSFQPCMVQGSSVCIFDLPKLAHRHVALIACMGEHSLQHVACML